jgi:hypothetical protein
MTSPSGYEDEHPTEYRPANLSEVARYIDGGVEVVDAPLDLMSLESVGATTASPTSIRLAADDPPATFEPPVVPPAALAVQPIPVPAAPTAPAPAPTAPVMPAPMAAPPPPPPYGE